MKGPPALSRSKLKRQVDLGECKEMFSASQHVSKVSQTDLSCVSLISDFTGVYALYDALE